MSVRFPVNDIGGKTIVCVVENGTASFLGSKETFESEIQRSNLPLQLKEHLSHFKNDKERLLFVKGSSKVDSPNIDSLIAYTTYGRIFQLNYSGSIKQLNTIGLFKSIPKVITNLGGAMKDYASTIPCLLNDVDGLRWVTPDYRSLSLDHNDEHDYIVLIDDYTSYPILVVMVNNKLYRILSLVEQREAGLESTLHKLEYHGCSLNLVYKGCVGSEFLIYPIFNEDKLQQFIGATDIMLKQRAIPFYAFMQSWVTSGDNRKISLAHGDFCAVGIENADNQINEELSQTLCLFNENLDGFPYFDNNDKMLGVHINDSILSQATQSHKNVLADVSGYNLGTGSLCTYAYPIIYYISKLGEMEDYSVYNKLWFRLTHLYIEPMQSSDIIRLLTQGNLKGGMILDIDFSVWEESGKLEELTSAIAFLTLDKVENALPDFSVDDLVLRFVRLQVPKQGPVWLSGVMVSATLRIRIVERQPIFNTDDSMEFVPKKFMDSLILNYISQAGLLDYDIKGHTVSVEVIDSTTGSTNSWNDTATAVMVTKDRMHYRLCYGESDMPTAKLLEILETFIFPLSDGSDYVPLGLAYMDVSKEWKQANTYSKQGKVVNALTPELKELQIDDLVHYKVKARLREEIKRLVYQLSK